MRKRKPYNDYLKYTGLAFQMMATMGLFVLLGQWLDDQQQTSKPYFTMVLVLIGVGISLYQIIRQLN